MSNISLKRLMRDYKNLSADLLAEKGIYTHVNEDNIYESYALILGPKDTPYADGFYFFKFNFCKKYPLVPPKVKFMTLNHKVRFNPNLYTEGKVCLSILGTWTGPSWTSCMNFETILVSLQSLLNDNPIQNEPGYETTTGQLMESYNLLLSYYNVKIAIVDMIKNTPNEFKYFLPIMKKEFVNRYSKIKEMITNVLYPNESKLIHLKMYNMSAIINSNTLLHDIDYYYSKINSVEVEEPILVCSLENQEKKIKRKSPKDSANNYDIGIIKTGLDGNNWIVKEISSGKRWFKHNTV